MSSVKICIAGDSRSGIEMILLGYLQYYTFGKILAYLPEPEDELHPITIQVMREDGIDITNLAVKRIKEISKTAAQFYIIINNREIQHVSQANSIRLNFADPLTFTKYDVIVDKFRELREEIKKHAIEIAGNLSPAQ